VQLARLAVSKEAHGDCDVPGGWAEDPRLGSWVHRQRTHKKKLDRGDLSPGMTAARAAKLEALGFIWETLDAAWEAQLARLAVYKEAHGGDCNVPQGWAEDPRLGSWVHRQRTHKKKLDRSDPSPGMTAARVVKLEALGFVWETLDSAWEVQLARLAAYKEAHGDCNVSQGWAEDPRLGKWVKTQQKRKKALDRGDPSPGMTAARAVKLVALGFVWTRSKGGAVLSKDAAWEAQLARLAAYKATHGDCNVSQRSAEDPGLGSWVNRQRTHKKKLDRGDPSPGMTAGRAVKLEALGFEWAPGTGSGWVDEAAWEAQLARLAAYKAAHGDCNVPHRWAEDPQLASWVNRQRTHKKKLDRGDLSPGMTAGRAVKLEALGVQWDRRTFLDRSGLHKQKCEDCGQMLAIFGLEPDHKTRWCEQCAPAHVGAVRLILETARHDEVETSGLANEAPSRIAEQSADSDVMLHQVPVGATAIIAGPRFLPRNLWRSLSRGVGRNVHVHWRKQEHLATIVGVSTARRQVQVCIVGCTPTRYWAKLSRAGHLVTIPLVQDH
jgi:hypothetical protein